MWRRRSFRRTRCRRAWNFSALNFIGFFKVGALCVLGSLDAAASLDVFLFLFTGCLNFLFLDVGTSYF